MDVLVLRELEKTIIKDIPSFKVGFKDESRLMKLLGFLSAPFNPEFMTRFTTTLGTSVYFPTREFYEKDVDHSFRTLTHEYVHLWDKRENKTFDLTYVFPQILALAAFTVFGVLAWPNTWLLAMPILGYVLGAFLATKSRIAFWVVLGVVLLTTGGLAIGLTGWASLALLAGLVCAAPWPAPGRTKWELRGYTMSIAVRIWLGGKYTPEVRENIVKHFVGANYYFMSWRRTAIEKALDDAAKDTASGALQGHSPPYAAIYDFLYQRGLLRR